MAIDPLSALIGFGGLLMKSSSDKKAQDIAKQNLALQQQGLSFQKEQAAEMLRRADLNAAEVKQANQLAGENFSTAFGSASERADTMRGDAQAQAMEAMQRADEVVARSGGAITMADAFNAEMKKIALDYGGQLTGRADKLSSDLLSTAQTGASESTRRADALSRDVMGRSDAVTADITGRARKTADRAGEDYNTLRSGFMNKQPISEEAARAEIMDLITKSIGTGDKALETLVNRQDLRQRGNMPVINTGRGQGKTPGQRLAEVMLQARGQALSETGTRTNIHNSQYLPGMQQFMGEEQQALNNIRGASSDNLNALLSTGKMGIDTNMQNTSSILDALKTGGAAGIGATQAAGNLATGAASAGYGAQQDALSKLLSSMSGATSVKAGQAGQAMQQSAGMDDFLTRASLSNSSTGAGAPTGFDEILKALQIGGAGVQSSYGALNTAGNTAADAAQKSAPDLRGIASIYTALQRPPGGTTTTRTTAPTTQQPTLFSGGVQPPAGAAPAPLSPFPSSQQYPWMNDWQNEYRMPA